MPTPALPAAPFARALVGVSGGRDSIALLHHLAAEGVAVEAAHVNYRLRGADSAADEALVRAVCAALGVPLHVHRVPPQDVPRAGRQAWARAVRYAFFGETAQARGLETVTVAHHADDQAETVLLALLRGGSLAALRGMRPRRWLAPERFPGVVLVRPLLAVPGRTVQAYADAHGLAWRDDAGNRDRRYRRALVRHDLLPRLDARAPGVADRLAALADVAAALHARERRWQRRFLARHLDGHRLDVGALAALPSDRQAAVLSALVPRLLPGAPPAHTRVEALRRLLGAQVGRRVAWAEGTVWREREALRFVPAFATTGDAAETPSKTSLRPAQAVRFGAWMLEAAAVAPCPAAPGHDPHVAFVPAAAFPLAVRTWRAGDRLAVQAGEAPRRVAGLLTRAKVAPSERAAWPFVLSCTGEPLWVPGVRVGAAGEARPGEACVRVVFSAAPTDG